MPINTEIARWLTYAVEVAATISVLHTQAPFDLVDFPDWGCEGYVHLLNQASWDHVPTVIQLHGPLVMFAHTMDWPEPESEFYRVGTAMEATCLRLADAVYTSSDCSAKWCARHFAVVLASHSRGILVQPAGHSFEFALAVAVEDRSR